MEKIETRAIFEYSADGNMYMRYVEAAKKLRHYEEVCRGISQRD